MPCVEAENSRIENPQNCLYAPRCMRSAKHKIRMRVRDINRRLDVVAYFFEHDRSTQLSCHTCQAAIEKLAATSTTHTHTQIKIKRAIYTAMPHTDETYSGIYSSSTGCAPLFCCVSSTPNLRQRLNSIPNPQPLTPCQNCVVLQKNTMIISLSGDTLIVPAATTITITRWQSRRRPSRRPQAERFSDGDRGSYFTPGASPSWQSSTLR